MSAAICDLQSGGKRMTDQGKLVKIGEGMTPGTTIDWGRQAQLREETERAIRLAREAAARVEQTVRRGSTDA